ncbi:hypothetical protein MSAN_01201800 [Mycena sanguinolenta]|uniref:Uncharacterized protein n=1 Tax=Mycena sanguinolenta TaxID=230812 RepID=A0A8H7D4G9_9AGAR|nr:hypothetical protein MSAN_01201800 [Mycena sanguinolenta]
MLSRFHRSNWPPYSHHFWTSFCSLLALPSMRCLGMTSCRRVPTSFIRHALSSYEQVALCDIQLDSRHVDCAFPSQRKAQSTTSLHRLVFEYMAGREDEMLRDVLLSPDFDLRRIRSLGFAVHARGSLVGFCQIALRCNSIVHLELEFVNRIEREEPIELPHLLGLRFLTLRQSIKALRLRRDMISVLETVHERTPNLEVVNVVIHAREPWGPSSYPQTHRVDSALRNLPRLRRIHFRIYPSSEVMAVSRDMRQKLPGANAASLLVFTSPAWRNERRMEPFSNHLDLV